MIQATSLKTAKKTLLLAGLLVLPVLAAAAPVSASALPTPPSGKQWTAGFSDEFNGTTLNTTNWSTCYHWYSVDYQGCTNAGNNEKQWYTPSQVSVNNGVARLSAEKRTVTGWNNGEQQYDYVSGMLTTGGEQWQQTAKKTMLYGYSEARIKVPAGQGLWPAFWMLSADYEWPPEIDIMEILGNDTSTLHMNTHWADTAGQHQQDGSSFVSDTPLSEGYHTFGVDWQPGKLVWYVDGVARKTMTGAGVPSKPMYLLLNLAVGGNWPGDPDATTQFPAYMDVDYVRTYTLTNAGDTTPPVLGNYESTAVPGQWTSSAPLKVTATDNVKVNRVEVIVDGQVVLTDKVSPYSFTVRASDFNIGYHQLFVRAYDDAGNKTDGPVVNFQVTATKIGNYYYNYRLTLV